MSARVAPLPPPDFNPEARAVRTIIRVVVMRDPKQARSAWDALIQCSPCSPYQTPEWVLPWIDTIGAAREPAFVVGYDRDGASVAFLPLCVSRSAGLRIASFLGGRDSNTALGLFHPDLDLDHDAAEQLLRAAGRCARIDLFVLLNQAVRWRDRLNPLGVIPNQASPSVNHAVSLFRPTERFLADTFSKKTRKRLRWKESRLAAIGTVRHHRANTPQEVAAAVEAYLAQKHARLRQIGLRDRTDLAELRRFLVSASSAEHGAKAGLELHVLSCGERIVATLVGAVHDGRFSGMLVSFEQDEAVSRFGPAELLIAKVLADKCRAGFDSFDLGIGQAAYKLAFCPVSEPLFDTILGVTAKGRLIAPGVRLWLRVKRVAKQTPWIWSRLDRLRRAAYAAAP